MKKTFSIKNALRFGWSTFKKHWLFYVEIFVVLFAISWGLNILTEIMSGSFLGGAVSTIISMVVQILISIGVITVFIRSARGQEPDWDDMWENRGRFLPFLGATILFQLMVMIGLIVLVVPGIYLALRYHYVQYIVIDDKTISIGQAFKRSAQMTDGVKWRLLLLGIVSIGIALLGILALVVGLFVALPVLALAQAFVYVYLRQTYHSDFVGEVHDKVVEVEAGSIEKEEV